MVKQISIRLRQEIVEELEKIADTLNKYKGLKVTPVSIIRKAVFDFLDNYEDEFKYLHCEPGKEPENIFVDLVRKKDTETLTTRGPYAEKIQYE